MSNTVYEQAGVQQFETTDLNCDHVCAPVNEPVTEVPSNNGTNVNANTFIPRNTPCNIPPKKENLCRLVPVPLGTIIEETTSAVIEEDVGEFPSLPREINDTPPTPSSTHSSDFSVALDSVSNYSNTSQSLTITSTQTTQHGQDTDSEATWLSLDEDDDISDEEDEDEDDEKVDENGNLIFEPKFKGNPAKGNFFISKEMICRMIMLCVEPFITSSDDVADEKLAFDYFKQSVAMQINDGQIHIHRTNKGKVIIIDIDLHFAANHEPMYLVAMLNHRSFRQKVKWQIVDFCTQQAITNDYGIYPGQLPQSRWPQSSRKMTAFQRLLSIAPWNVSTDVIYNSTLHKLPGKKSRRRDGEKQESVSMDEDELKWWCLQSWNNGVMIPVVVIKGKRQWVEWKKLIQVGFASNGQAQWVAISLRYYPDNKAWQIECMDYDAGRIYYQHRLVGVNNHPVDYKYLAPYVNTSLKIIKPRYN